MVSCHSCYIYGTWRSKEVGDKGCFKVIIWERASYKGGGGSIFTGVMEGSVG